MQDTNWGPWVDWEGGEPPVPEGTLIETMSMIRPQDLRRTNPPHFMGLIYRTQNGDSFRLKPLLADPGACLLLVYRYRVWQDERSIHSDMPVEQPVPVEGALP